MAHGLRVVPVCVAVDPSPTMGWPARLEPPERRHALWADSRLRAAPVHAVVDPSPTMGWPVRLGPHKRHTLWADFRFQVGRHAKHPD